MLVLAADRRFGRGVLGGEVGLGFTGRIDDDPVVALPQSIDGRPEAA